MTRGVTPLEALGRGVLAGVAGTAAMTAWQKLAGSVAASGDGREPAPEDPWESAPTPAKLARRFLEGVARVPVSAERIPVLTNIVHWLTGVSWGGAYGIVRPSVRGSTPALGVALGSCAWAASYAALVPIGLYEPPGRYPAKTIALDASYHLVYGIAVAAAHDVLDDRS